MRKFSLDETDKKARFELDESEKRATYALEQKKLDLDTERLAANEREQVRKHALRAQGVQVDANERRYDSDTFRNEICAIL